MSITAYEYLSILQATETAAEQDGGLDYARLLETVRSAIAQRHSAELSSALGSPDAAKALKTLILKYCVETLAGQEFEQAALVEKIYQDTETMGAEVSWDSDKQSAVIEQNGITVTVPVGSDTISVTKDGSTSTVQMDTQAVLSNERTYVPIRYVAEALGAWVGYSPLYTTVQIYKDVLTPAEITRLHGYYDMTWEEACKSSGESNYGTTDEEWTKANPQVAYFTGTYGFDNANEWKLRNPNGIESATYSWVKPTTYTGKVSSKTYTYGSQPDIDFSKLILAEANGVVDELNSAGKVTLSLRTDLSCVYASRHANQSGTYVRGVLTVTIPANADISWITKNYDFISNPKAGETRDIDVEIYVNTFTSTVYWDEMTALK